MVLYSQNSESKALDSSKIKKIETFIDSADQFKKSNLDSALFYADLALKISEKLKNISIVAESRLKTAEILWYKKNYLSAIGILKLNLNHEDRLDNNLIGRTYKSMGDAYRQERQSDSALVNYAKALNSFLIAKNNRGISLTYLSLGITYELGGDKTSASKFYEKSMTFSPNSKLMEKHKNQLYEDGVTVGYDYQKFIDLSLDIERIATGQNDKRLLGITYNNLKRSYFRQKDYDRSLKYALKEIEVKSQIKSDVLTSDPKIFAGNIYLLKNDTQKAIAYFKDALKDAKDSLKLKAYDGLKGAYVKLGHTSKVVEIMEASNVVRDSLNAKNSRISTREIIERYQNEKQQQEIESLNFQNEAKAEKISNQRLTLFGSLAGSVLLLLLGFLLYRNYRAKQDLNYSQLNFRLLQTQLNPHFMFNALNEIKLNLDPDKSNETSEHLSSYSKLMRLILEGSDKEFVSVEDDVSLISKFLQLQQLVHDYSFNFKIHVDESLDMHYIKIPPMLVQPFVENAVLHGIKSVDNGEIKIQYLEQNNELVVKVEDNGKGFSKSKSELGKHLHQSMGTKIIDQRINNYEKLHGFKIDVQTVSNEDSGTIIIITCPIFF
ncbi:tetratricopeptide repeat-containing sensor histidine kinase [Winogradskyella flava]|uniref:Histidine kinase n=1 Tax=Winogradskyella flava TaxID=1884876 RepID=A0A842ILY7_9FLAO|nr:histidine kinase [Winogradskyella flava]MBC2843741.1 histidine kinase [Winogradskyella flava]